MAYLRLTMISGRLEYDQTDNAGDGNAPAGAMAARAVTTPGRQPCRPRRSPVSAVRVRRDGDTPHQSARRPRAVRGAGDRSGEPGVRREQECSERAAKAAAKEGQYAETQACGTAAGSGWTVRPTGWFSIEVAADTSGEASRGDSSPKVAGAALRSSLLSRRFFAEQFIYDGVGTIQVVKAYIEPAAFRPGAGIGRQSSAHAPVSQKRDIILAEHVRQHAVPRRALFNQETGILGLNWAHMALSAVWTVVALKQMLAFFAVHGTLR